MFDASVFEAPASSQAASLLADWGAEMPALVVLGSEEGMAGKSFRNLREAVALPVEEVGVADIVGAASLLISEAALPALVARAAKPERSGAESAPAAAAESAAEAASAEEAA